MLQKDIALYAMDNAIGFPNTSPLDSDLSVSTKYTPLLMPFTLM